MIPAISILFPVRNGERTLRRALQSCLDQTFSDFELVAVDDGSTDGTKDILRHFAAHDRRIRILHHAEGFIPALECGRRAARGRLIARMDADDFSHRERLSSQAGFLEAHPQIAAVGCGVRILGEDNRRPRDGFLRYENWLNGLTGPDEIARERFVESPLAHPTVMIRREALAAVGGYQDRGWAEDYDLWLRMTEAGMLLAKLKRVLFDWYDGPRRLTRTSSRYSLAQFLKAKAFYLSRVPRLRSRGAVISGAGPTGKKIARFLREQGVAIHAFLEVHPRRIGTSVSGIPVLAAESAGFAGPSSPVQLAAVGQPGRRQAIRDFLAARGFREGHDFFCVA